MAERADLRRRPQRITVRDILRTAVNLEKKAMALYMQFTRVFEDQEELRKFWFGMARHEASHLERWPSSKAWLRTTRMLQRAARSGSTPQPWFASALSLTPYSREAGKKVSVERAFEMALDVEGSELEDVVVDLLHVVREQMVRDQAVKFLIHDLSDLSYMVEKFTNDEALLARADALVDHRVDALAADRARKASQGDARDE